MPPARLFSRREFSASSAATLLVLTAGRSAWGLQAALQAPGAGARTLREAAASRGLLAGCAVAVARLRDTPAYAALVAAQADIVVAESEMKMGPLRPTPDTFNFRDADLLADFAAQHGMKLRGHNFAWHRQLPRWFESYVTSANAEHVLVRHIETVGGRYRGRVHSWDVVNEAIHLDDKLPDAMRNAPWFKVLPNYIDIAFRTARRVDPGALLFYNDYGVEGEDAGSAAKRAAVLALVRGMKSRGVPVDGVGIQSHLAAGGHYGPGLLAWMAELRGMGLKLMLTEMDVNDRWLPADVAKRDAVVAATYANYLQQTLAEPAVLGVLTWGITDRYTWLNHEDNRADNLPERCLPFDAELQPKAAFRAELDALASAPAR